MPRPVSPGPMDREGKVVEDKGMEHQLHTGCSQWPNFTCWRHYFPEEVGIHREEPCPRSHSLQVVQAGFEPRTQSLIPLKPTSPAWSLSLSLTRQGRKQQQPSFHQQVRLESMALGSGLAMTLGLSVHVVATFPWVMFIKPYNWAPPSVSFAD